MLRLRHRSGKAITDPTAPGPLRGSLAKSPENNSVPWRITQLADDHSDGPRLGTRPVSASTFKWPFGSWAITTQHGAGTHPCAWRTSHSPTFRESRVPFASRTASISASRRSTRLLRARARSLSLAARSGRRGRRPSRPRLLAARGPASRFLETDLTDRQRGRDPTADAVGGDRPRQRGVEDR